MSTVCWGSCQNSKSVKFFDFWPSQGSVATYYRWDGNLCAWCVHGEFTYESTSEKILKIGPHFLPNLLSNTKGLTFLGHSVCKYFLPYGKYQTPNLSDLETADSTCWRALFQCQMDVCTVLPCCKSSASRSPAFSPSHKLHCYFYYHTPAGYD